MLTALLMPVCIGVRATSRPEELRVWQGESKEVD